MPTKYSTINWHKPIHLPIRNGFTLVETLVSLAVLGVFFAAVAYIFQIVLVQVGQSRVRSVALALGQSKMEIVRNLPFVDVGTAGGIPQGALLPDETITINDLDFRITTSVVFVDDPLMVKLRMI